MARLDGKARRMSWVLRRGLAMMDAADGGLKKEPQLERRGIASKDDS